MSDEIELSDETIACSIPLPIDIIDPADEAAVLQRTQDLRMRIVSRIAAQSDVHHDVKMLGQLEKLLTSADKQVLNLRRLKVMERGADAAESVAQTLDRYVAERGAKLARHDAPPEDGDYRPTVPTLPKFEMKDGELDPVGQNIDVEEIIHKSLEKMRPGTADQD